MRASSIGSILLALCLASTRPAAQAPTLPNRVAAGEVSDRSAVLWTRSLCTGPVLFEISRDPSFRRNVERRWSYAFQAERPVKTRVAGLRPGSEYHYRVWNSAFESDVGRFRTAPRRHESAGFRMGVSGDSRGDNAPFPSVTNVPGRALDLFVLLGDTIYADVESPALPGIAQATSLDEYRTKHDEVYSARDGLNALADLRASTALLVTIDDHEVTNDFSGGADPLSDPRFDPSGNFINETELYRTALQAFSEFNPLLPSFYGWTGDARTTFKRKLYREQRFGSDAAVFVLDARSFRDVELPPVTDLTDPFQIGAFLVAAFDPARTMLGAAQLAELKEDLLSAQQEGVTWKFILVPEPIQNLGVLAASDRFEGYAAERTELLAFLTSNAIENVVFVAADIHGSLVNNLTYQAGPGQAQIATPYFEVTTGAIAYEEPFGPTVVGLAAAFGLISAPELAFYQSLPVPLKDAFVQGLVDAQLGSLGYDALGLAGSPLDATLLAGSYTNTHVYGWTEFEIAPETKTLTVTTHGIDPTIPGQDPGVQARFVVVPR